MRSARFLIRRPSVNGPLKIATERGPAISGAFNDEPMVVANNPHGGRGPVVSPSVLSFVRYGLRVIALIFAGGPSEATWLHSNSAARAFP